jgi:hypothetical protein
MRVRGLTDLIDALPSQDEGLFAQEIILPLKAELSEQQINPSNALGDSYRGRDNPATRLGVSSG